MICNLVLSDLVLVICDLVLGDLELEICGLKQLLNYRENIYERTSEGIR